MKGKIENLLKKDCRHLEMHLKSKDILNVFEPNREGSKNTIEVLDDGFIKWMQYIDDGCTYERYLEISEIALVSGLYNCPEPVPEDIKETTNEEVDDNV